MPSKDDLSKSLVVTLADILDLRVFGPKFVVALVVIGTAEWRVGCHDDTVVYAVLDDDILLHIGVDFYLVGVWLYAAVAQHVIEKGNAEVGNTNVFGQSFIYKLLHGLPGVLDTISLLQNDLVGVGVAGEQTLPVLKLHRPVNQEEVDVLQL